jgi:organic hydroperoxide reductase OsmC/OhrA
MSALTPGLLTIPAGADLALAAHLHHAAHEKCYVANSLNFPILCEPVIEFSA